MKEERTSLAQNLFSHVILLVGMPVGVTMLSPVASTTLNEDCGE